MLQCPIDAFVRNYSPPSWHLRFASLIFSVDVPEISFGNIPQSASCRWPVLISGLPCSRLLHMALVVCADWLRQHVPPQHHIASACAFTYKMLTYLQHQQGGRLFSSRVSRATGFPAVIPYAAAHLVDAAQSVGVVLTTRTTKSLASLNLLRYGFITVQPCSVDFHTAAI